MTLGYFAGGVNNPPDACGRLGQTTANYLNAPSRFQSKNMKWEFNIDKANKILAEAGWKRGSDGIRVTDGKPNGPLVQGCGRVVAGMPGRGRYVLVGGAESGPCGQEAMRWRMRRRWTS
ncbi:MAG: hypothetical protein HY002_07330 [Candidatus Rokubacteria bacterium]|nr:hypothetical protein [Candidatus Rokubacteria bacterium]